MSEFEDRENEPGLNELPDGIAFEREENKDYVKEGTRFNRGASPGGHGAPLDITQQDAVRGMPGEMGSVPVRFVVTSTYDSRPINARDFLHTQILDFDFGCVPVNTSTALFTVPDGYVGVLRGFKYNFNPIYQLDPDDTLIGTVISDGVSTQNYTDIALPQMKNSYTPIFTIANSLKTIGLRITHPNPVASTGSETSQAIIELYGNLLLAAGLPIQYEIANRIS